MSIPAAMAEFIDSPTTLDFVARWTPYFEDFVRDHPQVITSQLLAGRYMIGYVDTSNVQLVTQDLGSAFFDSLPVVCGLLDAAALEAAGILQVQEQPFLDLRGRGTLIGIVDTGIDYTQQAFIHEDGTSKIQYLYDQTVRGNTPEGFYTGAEYTNAQINEALRSPNPYEIVPEQDTAGHGTFIASLAAGGRVGDQFGAAPEADLIVVKLRTARQFYRDWYLVPPEQENAYESTAIMVGIEYVLQRARDLGRPVSILLAMGSNFGSHDAFNIFAEYINGISSFRGVCVTAAVGNESQAKHHTQGKLLTEGDQQNMDIRVGNNAGNIFLSLWNYAQDRFSVSVRSPTGEIVGRVPARSGSTTRTRLILERTTVEVQYFFPVEVTGGQVTIIRLIDATPGIWTIVINGDIILDGTYHAWLPLTGFVSPTVEFLTPTPYYTLVVPSGAFGTITVGAYNSANNSLYVRSSWGPTRLGIMKPDLVAPGVNVIGLYPSGYGPMDGTSVSAAITAGAAALMLQWGILEGNSPAMSTSQVRAFMIRGCIRSENLAYPNPQWGFGRLNLINSFNLMREL